MTTLRQLAEKWHEVPSSRLDRVSTRALLGMTDGELLASWEKAREETSDGLRGLELRGWYHAIYAPWVSGKKIVEVGPGIGIDGVRFAQAGAAMTFVDISGANLEVVRRVCALKGLGDNPCLHLQDFADLDQLDSDYDAVFAFGSLHHIPSDAGKPEFEALVRRLKPGGRFVMHAYPLRRWENEGRLPFDRWGETTDGVGTPWAEWYDTKKLIAQLRPARFAPVLYCEYRDGAMNCIDLMKIDGHPTLGSDGLASEARQVPDVVRLTELKTRSQWAPSTVTQQAGGVMVTTPSQPWAYAADLPIHRELIPPSSARWFVRIHATVIAGKIGFAVMAEDGSSLCAEEYLAEDEAGSACIVECEQRSSAAAVLVRNASRQLKPSRVLIHSVEFFGC